jgi:hypothetical protein
MAHEANVRMNADRARLLVLAPGKWEEFKLAFIDECVSISNQSKTMRLDWDERPVNEFWILRSGINGPAFDTLRFTFDSSIPCIFWQDYHNKKLPEVIDFAIDENRAVFVEGKRAFILSCFVEQRLDAITR